LTSEEEEVMGTSAGAERRYLLRYTALAGLLSLVVAACTTGDAGGTTTVAEGSTTATSGDGSPDTTHAVEGYTEAPSLAALVESGDLPPIEERLPVEPYVVRSGALVGTDQLDLEIGTYGGTLELGQEGTAGDPVIYVALTEPLLWAPSGFNLEEGLEGNVLADWETNEDNTVFTFHMREGLRWSDGEPVSMDDVTFAIEDVLLNEDLTPAFPRFFRSGNQPDGTPMEFEAVDDWTFTITFDQPYGSFPGQLAISNFRGWAPLLQPRHYMEQFHIDYADPDNLASLLTEEGLADDAWATLFNAKALNNGAADGQINKISGEAGLGHPTLGPWVVTEASETVLTFERNPYYFKVDEAGNQLPYIDSIRSQVVQDFETLTSRALFGEFDYLGERAAFRSFPLMREAEDEGSVKILTGKQHAAPLTVLLNMSNTEEPWASLVNDANFREALSLGVNRQEIIDTLFLGEFAQIPSLTSSGTYDPEAAAALLDGVGLDQTDGNGCRLGPDGQPVTFLFELLGWTEYHVPAAELIAEHWNDIGICVTARQSADVGARLFDNTLQANLMFDALPGWSIAQWDDYLPVFYSPTWLQWYNTGGAEGTEPPEDYKPLFDLHEQLLAASFGSPEAEEAYEGILDSYRENYWAIQIVENAEIPTFFTARVQNVPVGLHADVHGIVTSMSMEQWYLEE
jgi:peptide/nickel transport system substrate-binding protein